MSDHAEIIREALTFGLEYHGHELDDVTGRVHAVTEDAKKFERAFVALDGLLADHAAETERDAAVADRDRLAEAAHDLNEYASNKAGYWQHPLTEKARRVLAEVAAQEGTT